ncbi:TIGR03086 family metal-binding protein [Nocardia sp. CA-107356]|uniref:TIGR03086 family metal-binding protein n=1 Tax=Nocardia sp. CA-107356 TaxID=3239972 RepID=UPI003D8D603F
MIYPALEDLGRLAAGIPAEQDKLPTPCDDFDVITLRRHLLGWLTYFDSALADPSGADRPDPSAFTGPDDSDTVITHLVGAIQSALAAGVATAQVSVPLLGGTYPGAMVIDLLLFEVLGHGWDLARATGRPWNPSPQACEHALAVLHGVIQPEYRGPGMPFGPEIAVTSTASPMDRLVAFTGRDPAWTPPR